MRAAGEIRQGMSSSSYDTCTHLSSPDMRAAGEIRQRPKPETLNPKP